MRKKLDTTIFKKYIDNIVIICYNIFTNISKGGGL